MPDRYDAAWVWDVSDPADPHVLQRCTCRPEAQAWIEQRAGDGADTAGWAIVENDEGE